MTLPDITLPVPLVLTNKESVDGKPSSSTQMRGGRGNHADDNETQALGNFFACYASEPSNGVAIYNTFTKSFIKCLRDEAKEKNGFVLFPSAMK